MSCEERFVARVLLAELAAVAATAETGVDVNDDAAHEARHEEAANSLRVVGTTNLYQLLSWHRGLSIATLTTIVHILTRPMRL